MGINFGEIYQNCDRLQSKHVLAWTWVISPAPDLLALVPENEHRKLLYDLTEKSSRGFLHRAGTRCTRIQLHDPQR